MALRQTGSWILFILLIVGVISSQYLYDTKGAVRSNVAFSMSAGLMRSLDLGLHTALASFLWINVRSDIILYRKIPQKFLDEFNAVISLDPKFSTPYVFPVLVLPDSRYPDTVKTAIEIGKKGVAYADPDWQIPFYLAVTYHLFLKDTTNAAKYFDLAAQEPGIPPIIKQFAINYGIFPSERERTKQVWLAVYESSTDKNVRARAAAYVTHFNILDYLDQAVALYRTRFQVLPTDINQLVVKKIIPAIPQDPFGLTFKLYDKGIVGFTAASTTSE